MDRSSRATEDPFTRARDQTATTTHDGCLWCGCATSFVGHALMVRDVARESLRPQHHPPSSHHTASGRGRGSVACCGPAPFVGAVTATYRAAPPERPSSGLVTGCSPTSRSSSAWLAPIRAGAPSASLVRPRSGARSSAAAARIPAMTVSNSSGASRTLARSSARHKGCRSLGGHDKKPHVLGRHALGWGRYSRPW